MKISYTTLLGRIQALRSETPSLRYGQAWMIAVQEQNHELYTALTGTKADPFYDCSRASKGSVAWDAIYAWETGGETWTEFLGSVSN